jgi:molybdopterin-containing oxidoreductase family iron-sulfur binding subunit
VSEDERELGVAKGSRRQFLKTAIACVGAAGGVPGVAKGIDFQTFFQSNFRELSEKDIEGYLARLEKKFEEEYGKPFTVEATPPFSDVVFGYGLDLNRCKGCRRCVYACVEENNQSRDPAIQWIRVLEFDRKETIREINMDEGELFYEHDKVPAEGKWYLPVACQQCEDPECTAVCPTGATWQEPDGIVVIDYEWCIGCRYCMASCPYGARHFNWTEPYIPEDEINTNTHVLGNRPRPHGVVEKCTFCIQRTRNGRYPACVEVCPVGARKFGNLLDPDSEIRYLLENKRTFVLKAEVGTRPRFFYFYG